MKETQATFGNSTFVVMVTPKDGGKVQLVPLQEEFTPINRETGKYVFGKNVRRLLNVKEIAEMKKVSQNEAQSLRTNFPFEYLVSPETPVKVKEKKGKKAA